MPSHFVRSRKTARDDHNLDARGLINDHGRLEYPRRGMSPYGDQSRSASSPQLSAKPDVGLPYAFHLESERVVITATADAENHTLIDITGVNDPAYIRDLMFSKLHIPGDQRNDHSIFRTELGEGALGEPVSDDQLMLYCVAWADKVGTLKFMVQKTMPQPSTFQSLQLFESALFSLEDKNRPKAERGTERPRGDGQSDTGYHGDVDAQHPAARIQSIKPSEPIGNDKPSSNGGQSDNGYDGDVDGQRSKWRFSLLQTVVPSSKLTIPNSPSTFSRRRREPLPSVPDFHNPSRPSPLSHQAIPSRDTYMSVPRVRRILPPAMPSSTSTPGLPPPDVPLLQTRHTLPLDRRRNSEAAGQARDAPLVSKQFLAKQGEEYNLKMEALQSELKNTRWGSTVVKPPLTLTVPGTPKPHRNQISTPNEQGEHVVYSQPFIPNSPANQQLPTPNRATPRFVRRMPPPFILATKGIPGPASIESPYVPTPNDAPSYFRSSLVSIPPSQYTTPVDQGSLDPNIDQSLTSVPLSPWEYSPSEEGSATVKLDSTEPYDVSGGYCDFFIGTCSVRGRVGLKRLRVPSSRKTENEIRRFRQEAETWKQLQHEHILPFWGLITIGRHYYLVSPFMEQGKLTDYFVKEPLADRARSIQQAALALKYLHDHRIIHGDIKGSNMLASPKGDTFLCDFGLAKAFGAHTSTSRKGSGTLRWSSPEIVNGEPKSFASDIWAFGMTVYELLSGNVPYYDRTSDASVVVAVMQGMLPPSEPAASPDGTPYRPLWGVANACWGHVSVRATSSHICEMLGNRHGTVQQHWWNKHGQRPGDLPVEGHNVPILDMW